MIVWIGDAHEGAIVPEGNALVDVRDHGLLLGDSLFETVLTRGNRPQLLSRHVARLVKSATTISIAPPSSELIEQAVDEVLALVPSESSEVSGRLRITLTSGSGPMSLSRGLNPRLIVMWEELSPRESPARLIVSTVPRTVQPRLLGMKTGSWLENVLAMNEAREQGAHDAVMLNVRGELAETTTANIFVVKNGTVLTPPLTSGCLAGVARQFLIENIPTTIRFAEMPLTLDELRAADEVFLTSSLLGVAAVASIADINFTRDPSITAMLQSVFQSALKESDV